MVFNSNADSQDIVSTMLDKAGGITVAAYPLKRIARNFNAALDMYFSWAFEADNRWNFDDINEAAPPIDAQNLVSGTNRYAIDSFTEKVIRVIRVEILTANAKGKFLIPETINSLGRVTNDGAESGRVSGVGGDTFQSLYVDAPAGVPTHYIKYGGFIYLRPNPNYAEADGLKIYFNRPATYMASTATTTVPGVPVIHHPLVAEMAANMFKHDNKLISLSEKMAFEDQVKEIVGDYFGQRGEDIRGRLTVLQEDTK